MRKSKLHLLPLSSKRVLVSTSLIMLLSGSAWAVSSQETVENGDAITAVPQQHRTIKGIVKDANGNPSVASAIAEEVENTAFLVGNQFLTIVTGAVFHDDLPQGYVAQP